VTGRSPAVDAALRQLRRSDFLPESEQRFADQDRALLIGHGQTNSQPSTVRHLLELLDVGPGARVLDVGAGSGWTTALLALLTGPAGQVHGVEIVPDLVTFGRANLARHDLPQAEITQAVAGQLGLPDRAPFDRILVSAEASAVPDALVDQLTDAGVMVVPVAGRLARVRRRAARTEVSWHGSYAFVPLVGG
jgi:protein-L-isoaspartate(D-aspartate) O-methyltransferase